MSDKSYKILAFDFDTKVLDEIYYKGNYRNSYNEFRQFLKENKFDKHPEGSFYISSTKISANTVKYIIKKARNTFDWFKYGVKDMRIANLESPEFSNLTHIAQNGKNEKEYNELIVSSNGKCSEKSSKNILCVRRAIKEDVRPSMW